MATYWQERPIDICDVTKKAVATVADASALQRQKSSAVALQFQVGSSGGGSILTSVDNQENMKRRQNQCSSGTTHHHYLTGKFPNKFIVWGTANTTEVVFAHLPCLPTNSQSIVVVSAVRTKKKVAHVVQSQAESFHSLSPLVCLCAKLYCLQKH